MTGYLHRLAQRANGTARLVRTAAVTHAHAGLPHALAWPRAEASERPGADDPLAHASRRAERLDARPGRPAAEQHGSDARAPRPSAPTLSSPPLPMSAPSEAPALHVAGGGDTGPQAAPPGPGPVQAVLATPPVTVTATVPSRRAEAQDSRQPVGYRDSQRPSGQPVSQHRVARDARLAHDPTETRHQRSSPPRTALPQPVRAPATPAQPRGRDRSAAADEATEVHVHIGRIEVTALQPAPAPRKPTRTGRTPLSLDDYLSRRRGTS